MALLVNLAKVALIVFLVVGTATFVVIYRRRLRRRKPLPPWPPAGPVYYGYARTPLPPWVDEYGNVIDPDGIDDPADAGGDAPPGGDQAGQARSSSRCSATNC